MTDWKKKWDDSLILVELSGKIKIKLSTTPCQAGRLSNCILCYVRDDTHFYSENAKFPHAPNPAVKG